jgi:acetylornithine deacetylase
MTKPQTTLSILDALIGFPSVSSQSNLDIVSWIEDYLTRQGVASRRIPDATGKKASILATIGPADRPGIVLSAHTDVVPVEGQNWTSPPFIATRNSDRIVGRGATDMKGFIACVLSQVPNFKIFASATPVHISLSYDEEVGCLGAPDLVDEVAKLPALPALCIVGEPTGLRAVYAHKGKVSKRVVFTGRGGHSALPHRAANAVVAAARFCTFLDELAEKTRQGLQAPSFEPPYTTIHVGSLHGGTALNLVPDLATVEFEIRDIPGADVPSLLRTIDAFIAAEDVTLKKQAPEAGISMESRSAYPVLMTPQQGAAVAAVQSLTGENTQAGTVSFGTEAGIYAKAGIPTVVCGPGDIGRAHKADEWIGIDVLAQADAMMERLARNLSRPAEEWIKA